jgi:Bacterial Ig-like domain (group 3)/FG-GAP-like repeat
MNRRFDRKAHTPGVAALFVATLTILFTLASLAQVRNEGHAFGESSVVSALPEAIIPAHTLERPLLPAASGAQLIFASRWQRQRSASGPMDSNPFVFLFAPLGEFGSGGASVSIAVGDVNGDGRPDLIVANATEANGDGSVGVLLGNGDGTFQPAVVYDSGGYSATAVAVADVNGDGKPDLLVANCGSQFDCFGNGSVGVLLGNGDGTFKPVVLYNSGGTVADSVVVADVNGDGKPDLLVANFSTNCSQPGTVGVLLGNGDGTFQTAVAYGSGGYCARSMAVADVNGDGKLDFVVANECTSAPGTCLSASLFVFLGNGDGTFQGGVYYDPKGLGTDSVAAADVNGDGIPDLVAGNLGSNTVGVLLGNGDGTFRPAVTYEASGPLSVAIRDVNGDGKPDLLVASGGMGLLLGNGDGTFQSVMNYDPGAYIVSIAVADVNGDGKPDVAVAGFQGPVGVLLNNNGAPSTTTSLVSSVNPVTVKKMVTYTATVTPQSGGTATGTVWFMDGSYVIGEESLAGNQAAISESYTFVSAHPITAAYVGNLNHAAGSLSNTLAETVRGTSVTKETTSGSPSLVGQPVTFAAKVTSRYGPIQDGEIVTFIDGKTPLASVGLSGGSAVYTTSALSGGTHAIKATYAGDATLAPSTGYVQQIVNKYPTTTTLNSSLNPSHYKQAVTFTAAVTSTGPTPTGKVNFMDGTTSIGSAAVSGGAAKLTKSNLAVGTHPISAQYLGDAASYKSTSPVVDQVVQ